MKAQREYIVPIDDESRNIDYIFIGEIRKNSELIRCKDCMAFDEKKVLCKKNNMIAVREDDWCNRAERKEE